MKDLKVRGQVFPRGKTTVMGILNVTPDSFSDGGRYLDHDAAVSQAMALIFSGAAIIDVGGESTRPGYTPVSPEEELARTIPVIRAIRAKSDVVISIDTTKARVAREAFSAGADIVNDVSALATDPDMAPFVSEAKVPVILVASGSDRDPVEGVRASFNEAVLRAHAAGIKDEAIIFDPGIGFGKTVSENLTLIDSLSSFTSLPYPLLLAASRKSCLFLTVGKEHAEEATDITTYLAARAGYNFVRVHDAARAIAAIKLASALERRSS